MSKNMFLTLKNGVKLPALGIGTLQATDSATLEKALDAALEVGYRHIDTAQAYENEHIIGKVLKKWFDSGKLKREDVFLTTKLSAFVMTPDNVEELFNESLKKLQVNYVDLYLVDYPLSKAGCDSNSCGRTDFHYLDIWKKMEEQHDAGRAKAIGVSNFNLRQIKNLVEKSRVKPLNNQIEVHVYLQEKELVDFCLKNDVSVVAFSPLGSRGSGIFGLKDELNPLTDKVVNEIAQKHSKSPAQISLRYLMELGISAIPKSVTPARIKENISIFDFKLDSDDVKKLKSLDKGVNGRLFDPKLWGKTVEHPEYPY